MGTKLFMLEAIIMVAVSVEKATLTKTTTKIKQRKILVIKDLMAAFNSKIYRQSPVKSPDIKNIIVVTLTFLFEKFPTTLKKHKSVSCNYTKSFKE